MFGGSKVLRHKVDVVPLRRQSQIQHQHYPQWGQTTLKLLDELIGEVSQQVKKSPPPESSGVTPGFIINNDPSSRVAHLEHSVRFLQEQHRLMLSGLHAEIDALRERNRDLQFQLIFNKESSSKPPTPVTTSDENCNNEQGSRLKEDIARLGKEAAAARSETSAAEAKAVDLQRLVEAQADKIRELELQPCIRCSDENAGPGGDATETRAELRARLSEAERLVRRLRADADRHRREVHGAGGVTNFIYDGAAAAHAHLHCMKNSLQASLRASGMEPGYGYHNSYHFPPVHTPEFWREPLREEFNLMGSRSRNNRRPLTLPELTANGQQIHRSTGYANNHTRPRANGYDHKGKKGQNCNGDNYNGKSPDEQSVQNGQGPRPRRYHHRKHATTDHT